MALRMHGQVSPKLNELFGDKFTNRISNNSDFDIFNIIEIQNRIRIDGRIDLYLYQEIYRALWQFLFFGWCWSECDVTYGTLAMAAIVCWQSEADCAELELDQMCKIRLTKLSCAAQQVGIVHFYAVTEIIGCHVACDECARGEICWLQYMWVDGSVMWVIVSGTSLKFGVQGASATNWFSQVNGARDNGIDIDYIRS